MKTMEEAKKLLESLGDLQKDGTVAGFPCPRCGRNTMKQVLVQNALSRYANVYICDDCGTDEAILDMKGTGPLPLNEWSMPGSFKGGTV